MAEQASSSSTGNRTVNSSIDVNICCSYIAMCFETYKNDVLESNETKWTDYVCGRLAAL